LKQEFYSNGKLLLTGEYLVLDGANALALPTKLGQTMKVKSIKEPVIQWESLDENGLVWFEDCFLIDEITSAPLNDQILNNILLILSEAKKLRPEFLNSKTGFKVSTKLGFPRDWGLGSSSTFLTNIASWAKIDAFTLSKNTFGGSGYDIAAAQNNKPILYSNAKNSITILPQQLNWNFKENLFFIHLNKKQNSREGIAHYQSKNAGSLIAINKINELTTKIINCKNLVDFETLVQQHEEVISEVIKTKPIKEQLFKEFPGAIKSLGAWGGDFILATGEKSKMEYFRKKGYETIISFNTMVK